jgi:carboxymethylenebutenolidase
MATEIEIQVGDAPVRALFEKPKGKGPFPGVVLTYYRGGITEFSHWLVDDLAAQGFVAIAPDHFHWLPSMDEIDNRRKYLTDHRLAEDLAVSRGYLEMLDEVGDGCYGILGHCMGGRTTLLGIGVDKSYKAACIWYGGGSFKAQGEGPSPVERIPNITAKVMGFFGINDKNPSPEDVDKMDKAMTAAGVDHEFIIYDDTGHGFMDYTSKNYMEKSAKDSWSRGLNFLKRELMA